MTKRAEYFSENFEINDSFRAWLDAPRVSVEKIEEVLKDIKEGLFKIFEYNSFYLLNNNIKASYDPSQESVVFEKALEQDSLRVVNGQCFELSCRVFALIKKKYPELGGRLAVAMGSEPHFFNSQGDKHFFLLLTDGAICFEGQPVEDFEVALEMNKHQKAEEKNISLYGQEVFVIDPSFKTIQKFTDSGYTVFGWGNPKLEDRRIVLPKNPSTLPVAFSESGKLFSLTILNSEVVVVIDNGNEKRYLTKNFDEEIEKLNFEERKIFVKVLQIRQKSQTVMARRV